MISLVSTDWLAQRLKDTDLVVIDATAHLPAAKRDAAREFEQRHIPGARFLDLASLVDENSTVPQAMPTLGQFHDRLQELGVCDQSHIVFYDDSMVKTSARAWFLSREFGYSKVAILDGGLAKWQAEERPLASGKVNPKPGTLSRIGANGMVRNKASMLANIDSAAEQVLDARDTGRFTGTTEDTVHNVPSGHIPGARNLPFTELFCEDGTYKSKGDLRASFQQAGIALDSPVVTTCGSGVTASTLLFALHLVGHDDTALYDGSWLEWSADPETPKATGPAD